MNSIIVGCSACPSSVESPNVMVIVQTVAGVTLLDTFRSSGASLILCTSELFIHVVNYTCIYKGIHMKSKIHHTGKWLEAARPPRCLCYSPKYSSATCLSLRFHMARKLSACLYKMLLFRKNLFLKNCARLIGCNLKWRQSMCVCSDIGLCLFFNDPSIDKMDAVTDVWTNTSPGKNKALEDPVPLLHSTTLILHSDLQLNCLVM